MDTDGKGVASEESNSSDHPKLLYKYLDRYGLDAIANLELKVTPPNEFNDPFEFIPRFVAETEGDWQAYYAISKKQAGFPPISYDDFRRTYSISRNVAAVRTVFQDLSSRLFAVLCLSADPQSVTQWGYYAAGHSGMVLELKTTEQPFSALIDNKLLVTVRYCNADERKPQPIHRMVNAEGTTEIGRLLLDAAAEKSKEWREEKEYRFVIALGPMRFLQSRSVGGRVMYFVKFRARTINRVILGAKTSAEFEREVRKAVALRGIPNDRVIKASIDLENYCVRV
jgi:hypothetical protein